MNEWLAPVLPLLLSLLAGLVLGGVFFGGLWWTVHKGVASSRPAVWFLVSLLLRTALTLTGFYLVADGDWQRMLACLLGFFSVRVIVTRLTGPAVARRNASTQETGHAADA